MKRLLAIMLIIVISISQVGAMANNKDTIVIQKESSGLAEKVVGVLTAAILMDDVTGPSGTYSRGSDFHFGGRLHSFNGILAGIFGNYFEITWIKFSIYSLNTRKLATPVCEYEYTFDGLDELDIADYSKKIEEEFKSLPAGDYMYVCDWSYSSNSFSTNFSISDDGKQYETPQITFTNISIPTALTEGSKYSVKGLLKTDYGNLTLVGVHVYLGKEIDIEEVWPINQSSFEIDVITKDIHFEEMEPGNYTIVIEAEAENGYQKAEFRKEYSIRINARSKSTVNVEIQYKTTAGNLLKSEQKEYPIGYHHIYAQYKNITIGNTTYILNGADNKRITVKDDGTCNPNPVVFYYSEKQTATPTKTPTPSSNQFYIWVNAGSTGNIRSAPAASATWLGSEKEGTRLTAYDRVASQDSGGKDWYKISYNGQIAYISTTTSSTSKPNLRTVTAAPKQTIRNSPTTPTPTAKNEAPIDGSSKSSASSSSSETSHTKTWQWSGWITKRQVISDPNTMKEESRIAKYGWWAAKCKNCGQHNPYWGSKTKCINCGQYLPKENVISFIEYTDDLGNPQKIFGRNGGRYINSLPYWRESGDNDIIEYRYAVLQ